MSGKGRIPAEPTRPEVIAERYVVERVLGRGGMATVYLCNDRRDGNRVAVKVLRPELSSAVVVERFLREIDVASELDHPQIPKVLDSGVVDELPFYVMTYIEGESLRSVLDREKQLPIAEAIRITTAIGSPATYAHRRGIVHRDIKPENILISGDAVHVLDFGIARAIVESAGDRLTSTGIAVGTPAYMSPEQAMCEPNLDARSDVYSLGCVIYEMIAGIPPFVGATAQAVMSRRFVAAPPPLHETREGVPPHIEKTVTKALARSPADRWQTIATFEAALNQDSWDENVAPSYRTLRQSLGTRRRLLGALVGLPVLAGIVVGAVALNGRLADRRLSSSLDPRRVAVLYFDDHTSDQKHGYLANGLTESLIRELSTVPTIQVISRNGVKKFRDLPSALDSVAEELNVGSVVAGSVQRSGNRIQLTAQLVDGRTNTTLETTTIRRDMGELFLLEDLLVKQVADMLRKRIGVQVRIRETMIATRSSRARELVFKADKARDDAAAAWSSSSAAELHRAIALLRSADSLLAQAEVADRKWLGPVIRRGWVAFETGQRQNEERRVPSFDTALGHANRAIGRDPGNAAAFELRGTVLYFSAVRIAHPDAEQKRLIRASEADLRNATRLDGSLASAWGTLSRAQLALADLDGAQRSAARALKMDAFLTDAAPILLSLYAATLMSGHVASAWKWCEKGSEDFPENARFLECQLTLLAEDLSRRPEPSRAWSLVKRAEALDPPALADSAGHPLMPLYRQMQAAIVSARAGDRKRALAVASTVKAAASHNAHLSIDLSYEEAFLRLMLGDRSTALQLLSSYHKARGSMDSLTWLDPRWKTLRPDTLFKRLFGPVPSGKR